MRTSSWIVVVAGLFALAAQACTGATSCVPGGQPACECTPNDSRACNDNSGASGVQYCQSTGLWTACLPFSADGATFGADGSTWSNFDGNLPDFGGYTWGG